MAKVKTPKPWERQNKETPKQFEAFCVYRNMGKKRSLAKVGDELGKSDALMERWSAANGWVKRVAAWDDEQERIERETLNKERVKEIKKMRDRHAGIARAMLIKATKALHNIPEDEIKASDISRLVDVASKLERISRGDVGEVVEERDGGQSTPAIMFYMPDNNRDQQEEEED